MTDGLSTIQRPAPTSIEMEPAVLTSTTTTRETTVAVLTASVGGEPVGAETTTNKLGLPQPKFDADQLIDLLTEMQQKMDQSGLTSNRENAAFNKRNRDLYGPMQRFSQYAFQGWPGEEMNINKVAKFEQGLQEMAVEMLRKAGVPEWLIGSAAAELTNLAVNIIEDRGDMESMNPDDLFKRFEGNPTLGPVLKAAAHAFLGQVMTSFAALAMAELGPGAAFQVMAKFQMLMMGDKLFEEFGLEGSNATWADFGFAFGLAIAATTNSDGRPMGPLEMSLRLNEAANEFRWKSTIDHGLFSFERREMKVFNAAVAVASSLFQPLTETPDVFKDIAKEFTQLQALMAANAEKLKAIVREVQDGMTGAADVLGMPQIQPMEVAV